MKIIKFVSAIMALVYMTSAQALAILDVDGTGQLMGASGVEVDGALYDVQFIESSCVAVYEGCDENSDFIFQDLNSAISAANALHEQVFLGEYDDDPTLTNGVGHNNLASIATPYATHDRDDYVYVSVAANWRGFNNAATGDAVYFKYYDSSILEHHIVWAQWSIAADQTTVVPEPGSAILLLMGLAGFAASRKLKHS